MLRDIQQVLILIMLMRKQTRRYSPTSSGGLLVLMWTEAAVQRLNCTIAAAGPWCEGITTKALQSALSDLKDTMLPCVWTSPDSDHEELSSFTNQHGSVRLLLSFQRMKDTRHNTSGWQTCIETFLHTFSLANAGIKIHFKFNELASQKEFRVNVKRKVTQTDQTPLMLDVTCSIQPPLWVKEDCWCQGGHPVVGVRLPLSIPPQAMDHGLFGELSVQLVSLLSPCVLQYPYAATELTHIQVLVYSPSNVPIPSPSEFFQMLPDALDCRELGLNWLQCSSFKDPVYSSGTVYTAEQDHCDDPQQEHGFPRVQQGLLLLLFLHHSDPFTSHLCDIVATEMLLEHHLEDLLNNNRQAVTAALQTELKNTLTAQNRRKKNLEKLHSATEVILSSCISIVSSSSNLDFRNTCLDRMKVCGTHELSASLHKSLWRVMSRKFVPRSKCYSAQMEEQHESDEVTRTEI